MAAAILPTLSWARANPNPLPVAPLPSLRATISGWHWWRFVAHVQLVCMKATFRDSLRSVALLPVQLRGKSSLRARGQRCAGRRACCFTPLPCHSRCDDPNQNDDWTWSNTHVPVCCSMSPQVPKISANETDLRRGVPGMY